MDGIGFLHCVALLFGGIFAEVDGEIVLFGVFGVEGAVCFFGGKDGWRVGDGARSVCTEGDAFERVTRWNLAPWKRNIHKVEACAMECDEDLRYWVRDVIISRLYLV